RLCSWPVSVIKVESGERSLRSSKVVDSKIEPKPDFGSLPSTYWEHTSINWSWRRCPKVRLSSSGGSTGLPGRCAGRSTFANSARSEEHTSELQSRFDLVCRL